MTQTTIEAIRNALSQDHTTTLTERARVMAACREKNRELLTAKQAMAKLGVSKPTLLRYVKLGMLTQLRYSSRRVRYDAKEVDALANNGI